MNTLASHPTSIGILAHSGAHQVDVLSFADCFLFMAAAGIIAMCLIPLMTPFTPTVKQPHGASVEQKRILA